MFQKQYARFLQILKNTTIEDYFGLNIQHKNSQKIRCKIFANDDTTMVVNIDYFDATYHTIEELSHDVSCIVMSYLPIIHLQLHLCVPENYPFGCPTWHVQEVSHTIQTSLNLKEYYEDLVKKHSEYIMHGSPALKIEHYLLHCIVALNHFEILIEQSS
jgi:hypothetical protein